MVLRVIVRNVVLLYGDLYHSISSSPSLLCDVLSVVSVTQRPARSSRLLISFCCTAQIIDE